MTAPKQRHDDGRGERAQRARARAAETASGSDAGRGHDKQGKQFGGVYKPHQKSIESATGILVLGLTSIHEAMADMADGHVDHDELVAGMFTKVKTDKQSDGAGEH
ncbi:hypothetical protein [Streptomyces tropicalis]|uniref:Uncharacterized protein n=1 Tax=Streptomyces tropicalis TaxID=3034234 RepID=A0ABT6A1P1_9ACTN|nr:hypothetical protein [Streptomyces tropicalis]MDF3298559.1 hypothetical protein [Streptomyces tropicalis]